MTTITRETPAEIALQEKYDASDRSQQDHLPKVVSACSPHVHAEGSPAELVSMGSEPNKNMRRGQGPGSRLDPDVVALMDQLIQDYVNQHKEYSVVHVFDELVRRIEEENLLREVDGLKLLKVPHISSFRRRMKVTASMKIARARYGKEKPADKYGATAQIGPTRYPHERWQVDHTPLDVIIVDPETGKPMGKPYLTVIIDVFSDYIVGFYIGLEHPSYETVMYALECAIESKEWVKEKYPEIDHEWCSYGLPEQLIVDNCPEFRNKSFQDMAMRLVRGLHFYPSGTTWHKPQIERFFHMVNMGFIHMLPGATFSNVQERKGYSSDKQACLTLEDVRKYFLSWLLQRYHVTRNRGVKGTSEKLYRDGIALTPPAIPTDTKWKKMIGKTVLRQLHREGIQLFKEIYPLSEELDEMRIELLCGKRGNENITVKYDPRDISVLHVLNPFTNQFVTLRHPNPELYGRSELMQHCITHQRSHLSNKPASAHREDVEAWIEEAKKAKEAKEEVGYGDDRYDFGDWEDEA